MVDNQLLLPADVAKWTRLTENSLKWLRQAGRGPKYAKLGRRVVYREEDVKAWIDDQFSKGRGAA